MSTTSRMKIYKNNSKCNDDLRRKREEEGIQLRKKKKDEQMSKRRNVKLVEENIRTPVKDFYINEPEEVTAEMVYNLRESDIKNKYESLQKFRKLLSKEPNPPINDVIKAGLVPDFVRLLMLNSHPHIQFEAAWALTNIASGNSFQTKTVIEAGAVPVFVSLLKSESFEVADQAVWALGNIAGDGSKGRDYVISQAAVKPLLELAMSSSIQMSMLRNVVWSISNLCRGKKPPPDYKEVEQFIPLLAQLVFADDANILADTCWAISYLSDGINENVQKILNSGLARRLVELLYHDQHTVVSSALRTVGNIVTGNDIQTQVILDCSVLKALEVLLFSEKESIRKETCWTISNLTAGTRNQLQQVIDSQIFPKLLRVMNCEDFRTKKECAWTINNATFCGSSPQIKYLVDIGCLRPMCDLLQAKDTRVVLVALNGLENILRDGKKNGVQLGYNKYALLVEEEGGLDTIESLQAHDNCEIYQKTVDILDEYFSTEDEDVAIGPNVSSKVFTFNSTCTQKKFDF